MKDAEDEAFDDLARRQGAWGGGYRAKRAAAADKLNAAARHKAPLHCSERDASFIGSSVMGQLDD